jgi:hypothetical protein
MGSRHIFLVFLAAVLGSVPALGASSSAPLAVGVTVVRSCSVGATPIGRSSAALTLTCSAGAGPGMTARTSGTQRLTVDTARSVRVPADEDLRVVTVNF